MSSNPRPEPEQLAAFARAFAAACAPLAEAYTRAMREAFNSPAGQYLQQVVRYYEDHPERLDAMIRAREAEAAQPRCSCLCQRWGHLGECRSYATTERLLYPDFGPVVVQLCGPCAASIDEQWVDSR